MTKPCIEITASIFSSMAGDVKLKTNKLFHVFSMGNFIFMYKCFSCEKYSLFSNLYFNFRHRPNILMPKHVLLLMFYFSLSFHKSILSVSRVCNSSLQSIWDD